MSNSLGRVIAIAVGLIAAARPVDPEPSALQILKNTAPIVARAQDVPAVAVAGVVMAEAALNVTAIDRVQDHLLQALLATHSPQALAGWVERGEQLAQRAHTVHLLANRWPQDLVDSGYVMSFGPAQLTPRTVSHACAQVASDAFVCRRPTHDMLRGLLNLEDALAYVAIVLNAEATEWERHSTYPVRDDPALLGTLYSAGGDYYQARHANATEPIYNSVGRWIQQHCKRIARTIDLEAGCER